MKQLSLKVCAIISLNRQLKSLLEVEIFLYLPSLCGLSLLLIFFKALQEYTPLHQHAHTHTPVLLPRLLLSCWFNKRQHGVREKTILGVCTPPYWDNGLGKLIKYHGSLCPTSLIWTIQHVGEHYSIVITPAYTKD